MGFHVDGDPPTSLHGSVKVGPCKDNSVFESSPFDLQSKLPTSLL